MATGAAVLAWMLAAPAHAGDVVQGANLLGMGGVGVAAPADNAGITLNPGTLGLQERFDFHGHLRIGGETGLQWAASAVDARTSDRLVIGLAYSGDRFNPDFTNQDLPAWSPAREDLTNRKRLQDFAGAITVPLFQRTLSVGVTGSMTRFNHDVQGQGTLFDLHAGLAVRPVPALTIGVSGRNLLPTARDARDPELRVGVRLEDEGNLALEANVIRHWLGPGDLRLVLDGGVGALSEDPGLITLAGGIDKKVGSVRLRAGGAFVGPERRSYLTLGLGTDDGRGGGFEYGIQLPVAGAPLALRTTVHQISLRFGAPEEPEEP